MRNLLRFILKYNFQILFITLEIVALIMLVRVNPVPRSKVFQFVEGTSGFIYDQFNKLGGFVGLREENNKLIRENAHLRSQMALITGQQTPAIDTVHADSAQYFYHFARVVNHSVNKQYNYLTLNVGSGDGVEPDMGVIGPDGIVGVVRSVSNRYSTVLSVLNLRFRASAKLKNSEFFGTIVWDGINYREAQLTEIPSHAVVEVGDTVLTSGYSAIFPEGEMVGTVTDISTTPGGNFLGIRLRLSEDFKSLSWVYVIQNESQQEQYELEASINE